jgi:hypothetical protein
VQIIFEAPDAQPGHYRTLLLEHRAERGERGRGRDGVEVTCVATERWPGCYTGFIPEQAILGDDSQVGPDSPGDLGVLVFPDDLGDLGEVFLLCRYDALSSRR